jgi:GTPase Era involved in 16S rRNA processing
MDLKEYEQRKFALAEIIRSTRAVETEDAELLAASRELQARLAEDRFNLLVVGRFSRGKSTLMNAMLGGDYLPTGIVPLTSVITTVRYGSRKQVVLHFIDSGINREVPLSSLSEYVTQKENPGNKKKIAYAELQFPIELLRRGLFFVDSPGLGSAISQNTQTTETFFPQADAFVLVTSFESPLSEEEDRILQRVRNANKKLYIVVNKQDMVGPQEREDALRFIEERLEQWHFAEKPQVFSLSARQALEARQTQDAGELAQSGLQAFENELMRFLSEERAQSFLANMYERVMNLLIERGHTSAPGEQTDAYDALLQRLRSSKESIVGVQNESTSPDAAAARVATPAYQLEIDPKTGCQVCGAVVKGVFRFISKYQYELTINPDVQLEHARIGGFCLLHTWQYEGASSPQGVCEAYPKLVHRVAQELGLAADRMTQRESVATLPSLLPTTKTCKACQAREQVERQAIAKVADAAREALEQPPHVPTCCLPHLLMAVNSLGNGDAAQKLLEAHASILERTSEDLQRYAVKHEGLRRYLTSEEERHASQLALLLLAGHRNVSSPWSIEYIL